MTATPPDPTRSVSPHPWEIRIAWLLRLLIIGTAVVHVVQGEYLHALLCVAVIATLIAPPVILLAALAALAWRARSRRGYGPLGVGAAAAVAVLVGKFAVDSTAIVYVGIAVLVIACIWNAWPRRVAVPNCSACRSAVPE